MDKIVLKIFEGYMIWLNRNSFEDNVENYMRCLEESGKWHIFIYKENIMERGHKK